MTLKTHYIESGILKHDLRVFKFPSLSTQTLFEFCFLNVI